MEGKIIETFRLQFVDIDASYNTPVTDSNYRAYMTIRAPKGSVEGMYFAKGQTQQLISMCGVPTADWPDIQDALDLNGQYGLWISAPAGSSADYPSYYGGVYVTKHGLLPFYNVTDKDNLPFRTPIDIGSESADYLKDNDVASNSSVAETLATAPGGFGVITISNISAEILAAADSIKLNFWGNSGCVATPGAASYELTLSGSTLRVEAPDGTSTVDVGTIAVNPTTGKGTIVLNGTNASGDTTFMFIDFEQILSSLPYRVGGLIGGDWISPTTEATYINLLNAEILSRLQWIVNVKDETYMSISQKSQTEKETVVTFTGAGYDKYAYDYALSAYLDEPYAQLTGNTVPYPTIADVENTDGLYVQFFTTPTSTNVVGIYKSNGAALPPTNVTSSYKTRYIRIKRPGTRRLGTVGYPVNPADPDVDVVAMIDQLYYVDTASHLVLCQTDAFPAGTKAPKLATNYNTLTFSVQEEVYPGTLTSGGTFAGSLSETGKDTYGSKNYFKEILPDTALSFIEVEVYRTFDSDISGAGFFTGVKIVDSREYDLDASVTTGVLGVPTLQGQRYVTKIVNDLVSNGTTGGIVDDLFTPVLLLGWTEAFKNSYEPAVLFIEPTGHEALKSTLYNLRSASHKMATFLAPRKLSGAEREDLESIVVTGRLTGTAQPVNEFLRKDTYTGKKYWTSLVGAYAAKCMRIIEGKLGGWAPMFTDIGGYGGQIAIAVERAKYEFTAEEQQILDEKGLNPIILDPTYGVMVISQKTTQDPDSLSDWSYLGHSMAFDLFKREVRDNVMIPQIGKPNDPYYQAMRQRQVEAILNKRIGGAQPIWAAGKVEISNVNTDEIKSQRKFKIKVSVKVNIFSEWVLLEFTNVAQNATV